MKRKVLVVILAVLLMISIANAAQAFIILNAPSWMDVPAAGEFDNIVTTIRSDAEFQRFTTGGFITIREQPTHALGRAIKIVRTGDVVRVIRGRVLSDGEFFYPHEAWFLVEHDGERGWMLGWFLTFWEFPTEEEAEFLKRNFVNAGIITEPRARELFPRWYAPITIGRPQPQPPQQRPMSDAEFLELSRRGTALEIIAAILAGANVNARDSMGRTALMLAAFYNPNGAEVIRALIENGADVNAVDNNSMWALIWAIGPDSVADAEAITALLSGGTDINAAGVYGVTALIAAATNPNPDMVYTLLVHGADVNARMVRGVTALSLAAAMNANPQVTCTLLSHGADVNVVDEYGMTPLIVAAGLNTDLRVLQVLLNNGANINARSNIGWTALMEAVHRNPRLDFAIALLESGAEIDARDNNGRTPLIESVRTPINPNFADFTKLLVERGADINARDNDGYTVLMEAARRPLFPALVKEIIQFLVERGADVKIRSNAGSMAVDIARNNITLRDSDVLRMLEELSR